MQPCSKLPASFLRLRAKTGNPTRTATRFISITRGHCPAGNDAKVDITINERPTFPLQQRPILRGYDEFTDLPDGRVIDAYSLEEIVTEKTMALADAARNEPRDLYDLWYLTSNEGVELEPLIPAIREKLEFRGKRCEGLQAAILAKENRLEALWARRLTYQMVALPPFEQVFRALRRTLRQANLP
jgi:predicted nucleotidyltransferase component of viral defense system